MFQQSTAAHFLYALLYWKLYKMINTPDYV